MHDLWPAFWSLLDPSRRVLALLRERFVTPFDLLDDDWSELETALSTVLASECPSELLEHLAAALREPDALVNEARELSRSTSSWLTEPLSVRSVEHLPSDLAAACSSPFVVLAGKAGLIERRGIGIVGTRRLDVAESQRAERWIRELVEAYPHPIVSGGALGVDTLAHRAALDSGRDALVFLAGGISNIGPHRNRPDFARIAAGRGVLVTERPPRAHPRRFEYLRRNKLIAAASDVVIVVRAPERSGALSTARAALALGRPVFAIPGRPDDPLARGCNRLLAAGARPYLSPEDLRDVLGPRQESLHIVEAAEPELSAIQQSLRAMIRPAGSTVDELVGATGQSVTVVLEQLMELELKGIVRSEAGDRVRRLR